MDYTCVECDSECLTCEGRPDSCSTCRSHMKLDPRKGICTQMCEPEVQVYDATKGTNGSCEDCSRNDHNCNTCTEKVDKCTSCKPGYVLNVDSSCRLECEAIGFKSFDASN